MGKEEECQDCGVFFFFSFFNIVFVALTTAKKSVLKKTWEIKHLSCLHADAAVVILPLSCFYQVVSPCAVQT